MVLIVFNCVLFGDQFPSKSSKIKILYSKPFSYWPDAHSNFFQLSTGHAHTSAIFMIFVANYCGKSQPIEILIDIIRKKMVRIEKNLC